VDSRQTLIGALEH